MAMVNTIRTTASSFGINIKHDVRYHLVQMQKYGVQNATGENTRFGSSENGGTKDGERRGNTETDLQ